jgi:cyclophilin family peptidyl-prolyl cis-trans isomerase
MKKPLAHTLLAMAGLLFMLAAEAQQPASSNPVVVMHTSKGPITLELYADKAPITVANFLSYVNSGHYENTIFHRVIKRFMIQGGGFTRDLEQDETGDPIINESYNGLHNDRWTLAMARTDDPDSATAQFFINVKMNSKLDAGAGKPGYAVFGIVTDGFYVVKAIEKTATMSMDEFANLPVEPVIIERIDIQKASAETK